MNLANGKNNTKNGEENTSLTKSPTRNITVEVSGSRFCIVPSLFKHIENLNWKKHKSRSRHSTTTLKLNANPDVFESVLQFFLSSKLPDPNSLSARRAKSLIDFVSPLDPVAVKPLVNYLQTFAVEEKKPSTSKPSFMKQSIKNISSQFSSRSSRSKPEPSNRNNIDHGADQKPSHASDNKNSNSKNQDNLCSNCTYPALNTPLPAPAPSIPTHIEHPVTSSTNIAEISVCSMDESSVSKLSLQSSFSMGMAQPAGQENENLMPATALQNPYQHYYQQNSQRLDGGNIGMNGSRYTQGSGFPVDNHVHRQPYSATSMDLENIFRAKVEPTERISNEVYHQYHPPQTAMSANNYTPIPQTHQNTPFTQTQTHNLTADVNCDNGKKNRSDDSQNNSSSSNHKVRAGTKIIRTVLGGSDKKTSGTSHDRGRMFFRKQEKMTHAEWCASASEYVV